MFGNSRMLYFYKVEHAIITCMRYRSLVTGGAGFIGSNIVDRLIEEGHDVVVIDNESSDSHENFYWNPKADNYKYDITDYESIEPLFEGIDYVFHLAAEARIQRAIESPLETVKTNVLGTANVLEAARQHNIKRLVYSTTSSYYGLKNELPNVETQPDDCLNPYSVTKVSGDKLVKMYYDLYGLETVILRYFNVYGDREPVKGQYAPVIGKFLNQRRNNESLTVVGDGLQKRDFTNVKDVVEANLLASTSALESYGEVFNVGTGSNISILELANLIDEDNIIHVAPRPGESRETLADISKIKTYLNWTPKIFITQYLRDCL